MIEKDKTLLTWVDTTKEHCLEFNRWSNEEELTVKTDKTMAGVENLNKFLNANQGGGLGTFLRSYIKKEQDDFLYDPYNKQQSDYIIKTALNEDGKPVGFMAFHKKFDHTNGETTMHILMFAVNPEMQGNGYGYQMMRDVKFAPEPVFGVKQCKVTCSVHYENVNCQKVIKKMGFVKDMEKYLKYKEMGIDARNEDYYTYAGDPNSAQIQEIIDTEIARHKSEKANGTATPKAETPTTPTPNNNPKGFSK